jgi:hypothetical protein
MQAHTMMKQRRSRERCKRDGGRRPVEAGVGDAPPGLGAVPQPARRRIRHGTFDGRDTRTYWSPRGPAV